MQFDLEAVNIDTASREIRRDGKAVAVEPKVFDLIVHLVESADRVVSKDELIEKIWDGRAISDATLSSCVKAARRALGDTGRDQSIIKTYHRRGFRFVGSFRTDASAFGPSDPAPVPDTEGIDLALPGRPSIAVLPFTTLDRHGEQELLAGGLLHDITVRLARTRWLFVTARASAQRFRLQDSDPATIGRALGVRYLLHGSVIRSADRFRLSVSLTETERGFEIWAETFDRVMGDIFSVQDEIGERVVSGIESEIELKERQRALLRPLASLDAWSAYHRGNDLLYRFSAEGHEQAEHFLDLAAELDPNSAPIFAGLSFLHWQRAFFETGKDREDDNARAIDHAQHAISLDPLDPQAHWMLGRTALLTGDLDQAVEELSAAVDLNPNFAKGHFSLGYGKLFRSPDADVIGDATAARRISPYDPMSFAYMCLFAEAHALAGDGAQAAIWARRAARQPNVHHHILAVAAWCLEAAGERDAALGCMAEAKRRRPDYSRAEFFRAYPYAEPNRAVVDDALRRLGI